MLKLSTHKKRSFVAVFTTILMSNCYLAGKKQALLVRVMMSLGAVIEIQVLLKINCTSLFAVRLN